MRVPDRPACVLDVCATKSQCDGRVTPLGGIAELAIDEHEVGPAARPPAVAVVLVSRHLHLLCHKTFEWATLLVHTDGALGEEEDARCVRLAVVLGFYFEFNLIALCEGGGEREGGECGVPNRRIFCFFFFGAQPLFPTLSPPAATIPRLGRGGGGRGGEARVRGWHRLHVVTHRNDLTEVEEDLVVVEV